MYIKKNIQELIKIGTAGKCGDDFIIQTIRDYLVRIHQTNRPNEKLAINEEELQITWKIEQKFPDAIQNAEITLLYENLYTFVMVHGVYVPYCDWVYEETQSFETDINGEHYRFRLIDTSKGRGYAIEKQEWKFVHTINDNNNGTKPQTQPEKEKTNLERLAMLKKD